MSDRADELNAKIQDLTIEGTYCVQDIAEACGLILGHCIRQMSAGAGQHQPRVLEENLKLSREKVEMHARKKCSCPPERPNCDDCGHPIFRHVWSGHETLKFCTVPGCDCNN